MGIYAYHREHRVRIEVSSRLLQRLTRKEKEKLRCFAASILAFAGIECQLASIVGFVIVFLLPGGGPGDVAQGNLGGPCHGSVLEQVTRCTGASDSW